MDSENEMARGLGDPRMWHREPGRGAVVSHGNPEIGSGRRARDVSLCSLCLAPLCVLWLACGDGGRESAGGRSTGADGARGKTAAPPATGGAFDDRLRKPRDLLLADRAREARALLEELLRERPRDPYALFYLALTHYREKRYRAARTHLEGFLELGESAPHHCDARRYRAWCLYYLGHLKEARAAFREHLECGPGEPDSIFGIGQIDFEEGGLASAEVAFRKAIELESAGSGRRRHLARYRTRLADLLLQQDRLSEAGAELKEAAKLRPDAYSIHYKLYRIHSRLGESEAAETALRRYRENLNAILSR